MYRVKVEYDAIHSIHLPEEGIMSFAYFVFLSSFNQASFLHSGHIASSTSRPFCSSDHEMGDPLGKSFSSQTHVEARSRVQILSVSTCQCQVMRFLCRLKRFLFQVNRCCQVMRFLCHVKRF